MSKRQLIILESLRPTVVMRNRPAESFARIAREHNINDNLLFNWKRQYEEGTDRNSVCTGYKNV